MEKSVTNFSREKINEIHSLSQNLNLLRKKKHMRVLLELMQSHAKEISELYQEKDNHYIIEIGDLLILCFEMLKESDQDYDQIMNKCYARYINKISKLIQEFKKEDPGDE